MTTFNGTPSDSNSRSEHRSTSGPDARFADDIALLRRVLARDQVAIRAFETRLECIPGLVNLANRRLGLPLDPASRDDVAQESILAIWRRLDSYEGRCSFEGWAWIYVLNVARNVARRRIASRDRTAGPIEEVLQGVEAVTPTTFYDRDTIEVWLAQIPAPMAETIRLKHLQGMLFREIAATLSVAVNTVKARYYRGMKEVQALVLDGTQDDLEGEHV